MSARTGMANPLKRIRLMTETAASDYTLNSVAYWTDDQLQDILDRHRTDIKEHHLSVRRDFISGASEYHDYSTDLRNFEETGGTPNYFVVRDSTGAGTAPNTYDYNAGLFVFSTNTQAAAFYLTCRVFNLNAAAAEVWEAKAAHAAKGYAFGADGARFDRQQVYEHCMAMAAKYRNLSGMKVARMVRSDVVTD